MQVRPLTEIKMNMSEFDRWSTNLEVGSRQPAWGRLLSNNMVISLLVIIIVFFLLLFSHHYLIKMWLWNVTLDFYLSTHRKKKQEVLLLWFYDCFQVEANINEIHPQKELMCALGFLFVFIKPRTLWDHREVVKTAWAEHDLSLHTNTKHSYHQTNRLTLGKQCCCVLTVNLGINIGILGFCKDRHCLGC